MNKEEIEFERRFRNIPDAVPDRKIETYVKIAEIISYLNENQKLTPEKLNIYQKRLKELETAKSEEMNNIFDYIDKLENKVKEIEESRQAVIDKLKKVLKNHKFTNLGNDCDYSYGKGRYEFAQEILNMLEGEEN